MRFYLAYKNRGLYDPILDETPEDTYIPDDIDQELTPQKPTQVQIESTESKESIEQTKSEAEDQLNLNLYYKDVFPEINLDELPPQIKYKLPVSEHYDPEGKRVKKEGLDKKLIVHFDKIAKLDHDQKDMQKTEIISMKEVSDERFLERKEMKEEKRSNILEEESELRRIKQTALQVIEDSLSKAVSLASQLKNKNESLNEEENKLTSKIHELMQAENRYFEKIKEKTDRLRKKVSFENEVKDYREEKVVSNQAVTREVHVADEVKKFEKFDLQTDSKLNAEERKLLTQKDIEEAIEAGTVRQRTGMFKRHNDTLIGQKHEQKRKVETVKTNIQTAKQRVFDIGSQIIPRLRNTVSYSRQSSLLLKRFLLQMTKVMVNLFKFIPRGKTYTVMKSRESYEEYNRKGGEYFHEVHYDDESLKRDTLKEGEIRKPKLSGAKIAQIEGHKPAELTDRMNIVISEFLRKSGREDFSEENEFQRSQTSSSRSESRMQDEYLDDTFYGENVFDETKDDFAPRSSFKEKMFNETTSEGEFTKGDSFRKNAFDNKRIFEETCETKTQSYEVKEFKEEKRYSASKTSQFDTKASTETESVSRDYSVPLTYIAIVEAHVFTNKNAIFEEQMRRMSKNLKQTDMSESDIIYYRCEVSVFYRQFREPSLPPTVVVESIEEIPSEQVQEEEKQNIYQTSTYEYEDEAKQLAVQKISEVIEPLLQIKEVKSVNIKNAYPTIEMPLKLISEQTTVTLEKEEEKTKIIETIERKPRPIVEPTKSIAETSEIFIKEETVGLVETPQAIAQLPRPVKVGRAVKSAAETSEVIVDEANLGILEVSQSASTTPRYTIADNMRSIAETMIAIIQEPQEDKNVIKITEDTSRIGVNETIASEVFEVFPEEPIYEEVTQDGVERRQSEVFMEKSILVLPETIMTSVEEPVCEELVLSKTSTKEATIEVEAKVVAEITEVTLNENEQESFDTVKITPKEPGELKEKPALSVGETKTILAFEPTTEPFEVIEFVEKHTQPFIEDKFLGAAETFSVLPEESSDGYLHTPNIETKRPKTLIEGGLVVAETLLVSPSSPEEGFNLTDTINKKANIKIEESKAITTSLVQIEEPKEDKLEVIPFLAKKPQASLQDTTLTLPMKIEVIPEGPKDNDFETPIPVQEKAEVDIEQLKTASVTVVTVEEPKDVNLEKFAYKENEVRSLLERPNLNVAETLAVVPEGPLCGSFQVPAITSDKPIIYVDEIKPLTISYVTANEPHAKEIENILDVEEKKPVILRETSIFTVPQIIEMIPDEPKDSFTVTSVISEQADLKIREFKGRSTTIVYTEEPKEEVLNLPIVEAKQQRPILEAIHLTAAETSVTLSEESKTSFDITAVTSQQAHIQLIEQKAAEASLIIPLEPRDQNLEIPEIIEKKPQKLLESPVLTAAENSIIIFEEKVEELPDAIKPKVQKAIVCLEGLKVVLVTVVITSELETEFTVFSKSVSRVAKVIIVESEVTAIAKATSVSVEVAKEKVVIKELDLSSPPSTVSSAPSSPSVEWNVFGVATGHVYRVQSPQETSLDIIKPAKELYGVDTADTSYTLTFEAEYEEEKEILHMEEFSDVVKNKQFWISDIKTMETLQALDARMQLTNVSIGLDARKQLEDSAIIKSRSQSFDTAAEFEVSLEQSRAISDVQTSATFDLKSDAGFKTMEDVESQAKVSIKSTSDKVYSKESVDVAFGLTIQNDIVVDGRVIELDVHASRDTKVAKATRRVKKVAKGMALASSESEVGARYEAGMNLESRRIAAVEESLQASQTSDAIYLKTEGKLESSKVSAAYASMEASHESRIACETLQSSIEATSVSKEHVAAIESSTEASSVSAASYSLQQTSLESQSRSIEVNAMKSIQKGLTEKTEIDTKEREEGLKLALETDLKQIKTADKVKSPSPEEIPSPLRDEYIFRLITDEPEETTFIPRDCSFTPESVHEEPIVPVKGMIPHIHTKIVRVLYSPPLEAAPEIGRKIEPVFTKPGLRGGSETPEYFRAGLKSGSQTPDSARSGFKSGSQTPREFTKEEILEIGRKSALLASEIDKTIRSIEEYKESVGISDTQERIEESEIARNTANKQERLEENDSARKSRNTTVKQETLDENETARKSSEEKQDKTENTKCQSVGDSNKNLN